MSDNLTPTPYHAGYRHGRACADHDRDTYNPPVAFRTEYDQGWQKALNDWDLEHGAELAEEVTPNDRPRV